MTALKPLDFLEICGFDFYPSIARMLGDFLQH